MASSSTRRRSASEPATIIVRKVVEAPHEAHHGGAWKIAYADFVTAMMAFFLLMWLLGMTDEEKRKGLADYFTPTLIEYRQSSAGSTGLLGGDSLLSDQNFPHLDGQRGTKGIVIPRDIRAGSAELREGPARAGPLAERIAAELQRDAATAGLGQQVRLSASSAGVRIELIDGPGFAMFALGTDIMTSRAKALVRSVARALPMTGNLSIRGHTDAVRFAEIGVENNWRLSADRADAARRALLGGGVAPARITRVEGVADREPLIRADPYDPRNRRIAITLSPTLSAIRGR